MKSDPVGARDDTIHAHESQTPSSPIPADTAAAGTSPRGLGHRLVYLRDEEHRLRALLTEIVKERVELEWMANMAVKLKIRLVPCDEVPMK